MPNLGAKSRITARRAEAQAIVTRMGQDRASGLGSPRGRPGEDVRCQLEAANRARCRQGMRTQEAAREPANPDPRKRRTGTPDPLDTQRGVASPRRQGTGGWRRRLGCRNAPRDTAGHGCPARSLLVAWDSLTASRGRVRRNRAALAAVGPAAAEEPRKAATPRMALPGDSWTRTTHTRGTERRIRWAVH